MAEVEFEPKQSGSRIQVLDRQASLPLWDARIIG